MTRYREHPSGLDFDSRQDEDAGDVCAECLSWTREELLEPCPPGVTPPLDAVCAECAEILRSEVERMAAE